MLLTESMILLRAKESSLGKVKQLNMCGYNLSDVSIVRNLCSVEILAFSVNNLTTLEPFRDCVNLRELYLRRNNISDAREIYYLQGLPFLRKLWLNENPLCLQLGSSYRTIILSILPRLEVLDNEPVAQKDSSILAVENQIAFESNNRELTPYNSKWNDMLKENPSKVLESIVPLIKQLDRSGLEVLQVKINHRIQEINGDDL